MSIRIKVASDNRFVRQKKKKKSIKQSPRSPLKMTFSCISKTCPEEGSVIAYIQYLHMQCSQHACMTYLASFISICWRISCLSWSLRVGKMFLSSSSCLLGRFRSFTASSSFLILLGNVPAHICQRTHNLMTKQAKTLHISRQKLLSCHLYYEKTHWSNDYIVVNIRHKLDCYLVIINRCSISWLCASY